MVHAALEQRPEQPILERDLRCHGTRYVRHGRGWYAYGVRTVRGTSGKAALRHTARRRLVRVARTYSTYVSA